MSAWSKDAMRRCLCAAVTCAAAFGGGAANALTPPQGASDSFSVVVSGHISPKCTVDNSRTSLADFGDILDPGTGMAKSATVDIPFRMECNTPYTATLSSKNGGLAFDGAAAPQFATLLGYSASLGMSQVAGAPALSCNSTQMRSVAGDGSRSGCRADSSRAVSTASGEGHVRLQLAPSGAPLLKGAYTDQLILRISPNVSG